MQSGKLFAFAVLSLLLTAGVYLFLWGHALTNPFSILYEGHVLWSSRELSLGHNIYSLERLTSCPWAVIIYPPLFMSVGALLIKCFGAAAWPLRALSMISTVVMLVGYYRLLRCLTVDIAKAILGVVFFATFIAVFTHSPGARVDMMAFMLSVWAMERFASSWFRAESSTVASENPPPEDSPESAQSQTAPTDHAPSVEVHPGSAAFQAAPNRVQPSLSQPEFAQSAVLLVLANLCKYQSIIAGLALLLFALWNGKRKFALRYAAAWIIPVLVVSLILQLWTGGYLAHQTYLKNVAWSADSLAFYLTTMGTDIVKLFFGAAVLAAWLVFGKKKISDQERLPYSLLVFSLAFTAYSMGIPSAATNHLLFSYLAFSMWCSFVLNKMPNWVSYVVTVSALANLPILFMISKVMVVKTQDCKTMEEQISADDINGKLVLSEDPFTVARLGGVPAIVDGATFTNSWRLKPHGLDQLVQKINQHEFSVIVINELDDTHGGGAVRWPPEVVSAIKANYEKSDRTTRSENLTQFIYYPKLSK